MGGSKGRWIGGIGGGEGPLSERALDLGVRTFFREGGFEG